MDTINDIRPAEAYSRQELAEVRDAMQHLLDCAPDVHHPTVGICGNLAWPIMYSAVQTFAIGWEHHSGDTVNPVPEGISYPLQGDKWEGQQLEYRLDLLRYMIKNIENHMEKPT